MISQIVSTVEPYALIVNFFCHITMFLGGLYIAIHSRVIPQWMRTCLWYIGCSSFLIAITIVLQWTIGSAYELSYNSIGLLGEILFNIWVSTTTILFFTKTVLADIEHSRKR